MVDKLETIKKRYDELSTMLSSPETIANQEQFKKLAKEQSGLNDIVAAADRYLKIADHIAQNKEIIQSEDDAEFVALAEEELADLEKERATLEEEIKILMIPKDENDEKNVILEIRAGTGGDEAALFGGDLLRMYTHYAEKNGFTVEVMSSNLTELGGVKEIILLISGKGAYSKLKYESGVHRVQRVPNTESSGPVSYTHLRRRRWEG